MLLSRVLSLMTSLSRKYPISLILTPFGESMDSEHRHHTVPKRGLNKSWRSILWRRGVKIILGCPYPFSRGVRKTGGTYKTNGVFENISSLTNLNLCFELFHNLILVYRVIESFLKSADSLDKFLLFCLSWLQFQLKSVSRKVMSLLSMSLAEPFSSHLCESWIVADLHSIPMCLHNWVYKKYKNDLKDYNWQWAIARYSWINRDKF